MAAIRDGCQGLWHGGSRPDRISIQRGRSGSSGAGASTAAARRLGRAVVELQVDSDPGLLAHGVVDRGRAGARDDGGEPSWRRPSCGPLAATVIAASRWARSSLARREAAASATRAAGHTFCRGPGEEALASVAELGYAVGERCTVSGRGHDGVGPMLS